MLRVVLLLTVGVALAGCASRATLPFEPREQPRSSRVSADYYLLADHLRVELDTGGRHLEWANIELPDGSVVRPRSVRQTVIRDYDPYHDPYFYPSYRYHDPYFGVGSGVGTWRSGGGTGVGVGIRYGPRYHRGHIYLWFDAETVGQPPWHLRVKLRGQPELLIVLPWREGS